MIPRIAIWTALAGSLIATAVSAQSLSTEIDPVCGLPRLGLAGATSEESVLVLRGGDDLAAVDTWPAILQLNTAEAGQHHAWFDPETRAAARRFYRLEHQPRIPLRPVANFRLTDHLGFSHELLREGDAKLVVLIFTDNAALADTWAKVKPLQETYASQGVIFWLINPVNDRTALAQAAADAKVSAPILHDVAQSVARTFEATTSGEAIVIQNSTYETVYRGPIEDLCAAPGGISVQQSYLADALAQAVVDKPVALERVRARGTALPLHTRTVPNYAETIGPLLTEKCANCHRPGGIGTWAMTSHAAVVTKTQLMRENLLEGLMPPWHADPAHQSFANDFSLTPAQQATLVDWLDAGAPRGEGSDPLTNVTSDPNSDWPLGKPDVVLKIPTQSIPATGKIAYKYLFATNPFRTNVWLRAAVVKPGNKTVVHHALIFYARSLNDLLQVQAGLGGFFAGYVPGMDQTAYPEGTGKLAEAATGAAFIFQMHYTANGTATTDQTQLGLYLASAPPARALQTVAGYDTAFTLPADSRGTEVVAERVLSRDSVLHEMSPHMHFRGDRMRFEAFYPDGTNEILLNVPKYDFAWQAMYRLNQPKNLPAGTRIRITGAFDNSAYNPFNPDPKQTVTFGEQTTDEMFIGYLGVSEAR